ncbi:hypothetical protein [Chitinophaga caseinilytica]|uniref:Lipoprotein n=1 Tax=Chitinophaga caseinilytica TaxID=2267521 RepID=A0ABZ2Z2M0_9BACT
MKFGRMLFFAAAMLMIGSSCKKSEQIPTLDHSLQFSETYCNDPWSNDIQRTDPDFLKKLDAWLEAKTGVAIPEPLLKFHPGNAGTCSACTCKTGNVLTIWLPKGVDAKFTALGFK